RVSTWIDRVRSPLVTAVATSAMARTWLVRFAARRFTLPVRSFQVPAAPGTFAWPPSRPSTPTSRATFVTCSAKVASVSVMLLMVSASAALPLHRALPGQVAPGHGGRHLGDVAYLGGKVGAHGVHRVGEVLPRSGNTWHHRLHAESPFGSHLARHAGHFRGEGAELLH